MPEFKTVRGMRDLVSDEAQMIRRIEGAARKVAELYGFMEVITPVVESYELLAAKAGDEVKSRMFVFKDLGGRDVALRAEFTASVARLVATTLRNEPRPLKLFSIGSIYRYDEPQKGRYREFWQSNYELMGSKRPEADAEILLLTNSLMKEAGLKDYAFKIGSVGVIRGIFSQESIADNVQNAVMQLLDKKLVDDALKRIAEAGVSEKCLTVLRKLVELRGSNVFDVLEEAKACVKDYDKALEAAENLGEVLRLVIESGCGLDLTVDAGFARGLEYYTGMIFEVYVPNLDIALGGGGRYDKLIELFGGDPTPAVGVAHGLDRIMLALQEQKVPHGKEERKSVVIIPISEQLRGEALKISQMLRDGDVAAETEIMGRKMAKALEDADRRNMDFAVIVGEREFKEGSVVIRDLKRREQKTVRIEGLVEATKD